MEFYLSVLLTAGILFLSLCGFLLVAGLVGGIGWLVSICIFWLSDLIGIKINDRSIFDVDEIGVKTFLVWFVVGFPLGYLAGSKMYTDLTDKKVERVRVVTSNVPEPFILVSQTTPKHYYVTLKHERLGTLYDRQYVSKHCNSYMDNKPGMAYNLMVQTWHYEDAPSTEYINFTNLYNEFCGSTK